MREAAAQYLGVPARRTPGSGAASDLLSKRKSDPNAQMLVKADVLQYDYNNSLVSAVGHVQIYYNGSILEADKVIYDQKTKRMRAEGNVRLTEKDGKIIYATSLDLNDDYRDGFVDSLRLDSPDKTRIAATRADRSGRQHHGVPERRLHRLRGVQGRSQEAASVADQGRRGSSTIKTRR